MKHLTVLQKKAVSIAMDQFMSDRPRATVFHALSLWNLRSIEIRSVGYFHVLRHTEDFFSFLACLWLVSFPLALKLSIKRAETQFWEQYYIVLYSTGGKSPFLLPG